MGKLTMKEIDDYLNDVPLGKKAKRQHPLHRKHKSSRESKKRY
jgi:hypothetical protein